jgi:hypothetical protein
MRLTGQCCQLDDTTNAMMRPMGRCNDAADGTMERQWDDGETMGLMRWMAVVEEGSGQLTQLQKRMAAVMEEVEGNEGNPQGGSDGWGRRTKGLTRAADNLDEGNGEMLWLHGNTHFLAKFKKC